MRSRLLGSVCVVLALAAPVFAFEVTAVVKRIDAERRVAVVEANGREHTARIAADARIEDEAGKALEGGLAAKSLKEGATVTLVVEPVDNRPTILSIRLGTRTPPRPGNAGPQRPSVGRDSVGFKPLTEMTAGDRYQGEEGGLYGEGRNEPPKDLADAAREATAAIRPRDADGRPAENGTIGLVSISMSNATQEFSRFKQLADADSRKSPRVTIVDCAQGGQTMVRWADPEEACWREAERRLQVSRVSPQQVQVAWVKLANGGPRGELRRHGSELERDTLRVLGNLKRRFPNLRIAYLGSRVYGGYAEGQLNPEPYAYEGAFVARWIIRKQSLNDAAGDGAKVPLALWGPYLWGDGRTPRQDGLVWERADFVEDGVHPSESGRRKVAEQLRNFFLTDPNAKTWFAKR